MPTKPAMATTQGYLVIETKSYVVIALTISDGLPNDMQLVDKRMLVDLNIITLEKAPTRKSR